MELTNAIQSELHVKKELARRMGELQEELHNIKEQVESHKCTGNRITFPNRKWLTPFIGSLVFSWK